MISLFLAAMICMAIIHAILSTMSIIASQRLIEKGVPEKKKEGKFPRIVIVLPVLREERIIEDTLEHFANLNYPQDRFSIVVVTTEKEKASNCKPNTIDIVWSLRRRYPMLKILHYPHPDGLKADQINYMADNFHRLFPGENSEETFYAFYDADSRPERDTLMIFSRILLEHKKVNVFQQSASYLNNYAALSTKGFFEGNLLKAQALKQTRFILAHEIPRIQRVFKATSGRSKGLLDRATYAPTIGHGLFVRVSFLDEVRFPPRHTPEDMFWGFLVTSLGEPIVFIPSLDRSETPDSIRKLFHQLASWFKGPLLGFTYRRFLRESFPKAFKRNRTRVTLMSLFALADAASWLATSFLMWLCIIACVLWNWMVPLFIMLIIVHLAGIILIMDRNLPREYLTLTEKLVVSVFSILVLFVYSAPAIFALMRMAQGRVVFHKTER